MTPQEKAIKLSKSHAFSTLWRVSDPKLLNSLFNDFKKVMKIQRVHFVHKLSFEIMIANLINASENGRVVRILLSASLSYDITDLKMKIPAKHFSRVVKFLIKKKLITFYKGYVANNKSYSSKIIPNESFLSVIPTEVEKKKAKAPLIILKNSEKKIIKYHEETPKIKWLSNYNTLLKKTYISIGPKLLTPQQVYRVYNVNYKNGGRFYGADFQILPKKDRKKILIDGVDCVELDFQCLHVHLLYLKEESKLEGDAYLIDSYGPQMRAFVKFALMIVLNAPSIQAARRAITFKATKLKVKINVSHLMTELEKRHKIIAHHFYKAEVAGELQNIESNIAASIIRYFSKRNIVVLPIHDGFVVQSKYVVRLRKKMREFFKKYTGSSFKIPVLRA